jgi:hypothetical protein
LVRRLPKLEAGFLERTTGFEPATPTLVAEAFGATKGVTIPSTPGQTIFAYTAEPNSPSQDTLNLLASWTSKPDQVSVVQADEEA